MYRLLALLLVLPLGACVSPPAVESETAATKAEPRAPVYRAPTDVGSDSSSSSSSNGGDNDGGQGGSWD